jgi:hypothetical protein
MAALEWVPAKQYERWDIQFKKPPPKKPKEPEKRPEEPEKKPKKPEEIGPGPTRPELPAGGPRADQEVDVPRGRWGSGIENPYLAEIVRQTQAQSGRRAGSSGPSDGKERNARGQTIWTAEIVPEKSGGTKEFKALPPSPKDAPTQDFSIRRNANTAQFPSIEGRGDTQPLAVGGRSRADMTNTAPMSALTNTQPLTLGGRAGQMSLFHVPEVPRNIREQNEAQAQADRGVRSANHPPGIQPGRQVSKLSARPNFPAESDQGLLFQVHSYKTLT